MKPIFERKRHVVKLPNGGSMVEQVIHVHGWTTAQADKPAKIVISAMTGSGGRQLQASSQKLCDALNKAWSDFYNG
jgi:hypothetical protein